MGGESGMFQECKTLEFLGKERAGTCKIILKETSLSRAIKRHNIIEKEMKYPVKPGCLSTGPRIVEKIRGRGVGSYRASA
jgi:hypothetical protein